MTMTTILKFILAFLSLFFQFYSVHASLFLGGKRPPKKPKPAGSQPATGAGKKKRRRRKRNRRSKTSAKNLPRLEKEDATFIMRSEQLESTLKMVQSSLVAQSITGRLTCPVPDGNGKRVMVHPLITSFPINGNSDTGEPSMVDANGHLSLLLKPSLKETITARKVTQANASESFSSTVPTFDTSGTYSGKSGQHLTITVGATGYTDLVNKTTSKVDAVLDGTGKKVWFAPNLPSSTTTNVFTPNITISAGSNTLNVDESKTGYVMSANDVITWTVIATAASNNWGVNLLNLTTNAEMVLVTAGNGRATFTATAGVTAGLSAGDRVVPILVQGTASNVLITGLQIGYVAAAAASDYVNVTFDMAAADDTLWESTFKKSRITSFCVWLQNSSNITKVAGQLAGFWLNPDQAAEFSLSSPGSLIAQASSLTRDAKVVPWNKGFYSFERIKDSMLIFQPSLDMDSGYRLVIAGLPTHDVAITEIQGFIHVFMTVESEVESKILKAPIAPDSPNAIALWKTAMAEIPNNCMENAQHASILKSIMKGVRGIAAIPWVRNALNSMGNAAIDSLASSAYNAIPQSMPVNSYYQDYTRRPYY